MSLTSPGVEVTVIDESNYLPAPTNSVPFVLIATAQDKVQPDGISPAVGTLKATANKLYRVTSQRDLINLMGTPTFYTTSGGVPLQGSELNEYGLLAAYSALAVTNSLYVIRADINLDDLIGSSGRPTANPPNNTYWLNTTTTDWGMYEWNATLQSFVSITPIVITDSTLIVAGIPVSTLGTPGDYAVNAIPDYTYPSNTTAGMFFYKDATNTWLRVGDQDWYAEVPTIVGTNAPSSLTAGNTFTIDIGGGPATITVASPNDVGAVSTAINALGWEYLSASVNADGKLEIFNSSPAIDGTTNTVVIAAGSGTVLTDLGITPDTYNAPAVFFGTNAQQPLWQTGQSTPRPSGSIWFVTSVTGSGLNTDMSVFNSVTSSWVPKTVNTYTSDQTATNSLDATGGQAIPADTIYGQIPPISESGYRYYKRIATGPTVVTGDNTSPDFTAGPYTALVRVSVPGVITLTEPYTITLADNSDAEDFQTAWYAAGIPYTECNVLDSGAIQLVHTEGGQIILNDADSDGVSTGFFIEAGFTPEEVLGCKYGIYNTVDFEAGQVAATGSGTGLELTVRLTYGYYAVISIDDGGTGHAVGDIVTFAGADLGGVTPTNNFQVEVTELTAGAVTGVVTVGGDPTDSAQRYLTQLSNWGEFTYEANEGAPVIAPSNGTNWFYSVVNQVDIMTCVSIGGTNEWRGYRNVNYNSSGFPLPSGSNSTDPNGPLVSATEPTVQSDGTPLAYGDLWIDTSDIENYPVINRWQSVNGVDQFVLINNADAVSSNGIVFADARWATNGTTNPADDPIPTIVSLLTSNYTDIDVPEAALYPVGCLLFNTRRSGYNVKQYDVNYFNAQDFPDATLPTEKDAWVSVSGNYSNGAAYMGRSAQRNMVVKAMRSALDTNLAIRDEDNFFNIIAAPNYCEVQANMIAVSADRDYTAFVIGDTPMGLSEQAQDIIDWATNVANTTSTDEQGLVTRNQYMGLFYPSGLSNDLSGNLVAVPPSHMMLRTLLRNDDIAYPWLAPAGVRRGLIENAASLGYLDRDTGEFITTKTRLGIRDVLYTYAINPLVFFTGNGLLNYGNKTSFIASGSESTSALDRINVARLVAYIRRQLTLIARPFVFEPNDASTRQNLSAVIESLMLDLQAKRGIYDYLVICDESNNFPARIDRNELWVDVAIEPVKAAEFIYIPVRILNTGELSKVI